MSEQEKRPSLAEMVDQASSTGRLMRLTKFIAGRVPQFPDKAMVASYFGDAWVGIDHNGFRFLIRSNVSENQKVLLVSRDLPENRVEIAQFIYKGMELSLIHI